MSIVTKGLGGNQLVLQGLGEECEITGIGTPSEEASGTGTINVIYEFTVPDIRGGYYRKRRRPHALLGVGTLSEEASGIGSIKHTALNEITDEDIEAFMGMLMLSQ